VLGGFFMVATKRFDLGLNLYIPSVDNATIASVISLRIRWTKMLAALLAVRYTPITETILS
jgi:hypothetical protein